MVKRLNGPKTTGDALRIVAFPEFSPSVRTDGVHFDTMSLGTAPKRLNLVLWIGLVGIWDGVQD
jgi:hypothetical protein